MEPLLPAVHGKLRWNTYTYLLKNNVLCELLWNNHIFDSGTTIALEHLLWNSDDAGTITYLTLEQPLRWNTYSGTVMTLEQPQLLWNNHYQSSGTLDTLEQR